MIEIDRYNMVNDFGNVVNPLMVEGQAHGGIVQGLGQALMENALYDSEGQLQTGSYMDYAVPRASDVPNFTFATHAVPATTNPSWSQGLRGGRLRRLASLYHERPCRCARASRCPTYRHASNARKSLGRHTERKGRLKIRPGEKSEYPIRRRVRQPQAPAQGPGSDHRHPRSRSKSAAGPPEPAFPLPR